MNRGISLSSSDRCRTRCPTTASRTRRPSSSSWPSATGVQVTRGSGSRCATRRAPKDSDGPKCERIATALSANRGVVAVLGPTLSTCASLMLPILNRAAGGPVAQLGIGTTYLGLTRDGPGVEDGRPRAIPPVRRPQLPAHHAGGRCAGRGVGPRCAGGGRSPRLRGPRRDQVRAGCRDGVHGGGRPGRTRGRRHRAVGRGGVRVPRAGCPDRRSARRRRLPRRRSREQRTAPHPRSARRSRQGRRDPGPRRVRRPRADRRGGGGARGGLHDQLVGCRQQRPAAARAGVGSGVHATLRVATLLLRRPCGPGDRARARRDRELRRHARRVLGALQRTRTADGLLGTFGFDEFGDSSLRGVSLYRIEGGRMRYVRTVEVPDELLGRD